MDVTTIQTLITSLGFPIVCVIALGWFIEKSWENIQAENKAREEKLYTVIATAQDQNEQLSKTNAEFVTVLNAYKQDLQEIKDDVTEIKNKIQ